MRCWDKSQAFYILDRPFVITQLLSDQRWRKNKKGGKNFLFLYWNKWRCEKGRSFIELPSRDVKKRTNFDLFLRVIGKYNNSKEINQFFISFFYLRNQVLRLLMSVPSLILHAWSYHATLSKNSVWLSFQFVPKQEELV